MESVGSESELCTWIFFRRRAFGVIQFETACR
jgi:hypothetical protein